MFAHHKAQVRMGATNLKIVIFGESRIHCRFSKTPASGFAHVFLAEARQEYQVLPLRTRFHISLHEHGFATSYDAIFLMKLQISKISRKNKGRIFFSLN